MTQRKEKLELELQIAAVRRRLLNSLQELQEMADFFDGPSAMPPSLPRDRQEHIADALRELLRLGRTTVSSKGKLFERARTTITQWLQLLPKSKEPPTSVHFVVPYAWNHCPDHGTDHPQTLRPQPGSESISVPVAPAWHPGGEC